MKKKLMLPLAFVANFLFVHQVISTGCSLWDINNYLNNIVTPTSINNAWNRFHSGGNVLGSIFHLNGDAAALFGSQIITNAPITNARAILATRNPGAQKSNSEVSQIINNSDYYYEVIDLDNNSVVAIINKGVNNVSLHLHGSGYRLEPYRNYIAGNVATSVKGQGSAAYQAAGGSLSINPEALHGQGVSVSQSLGVIANSAPRSHAVIVWPQSRSFPRGFPFKIAIALDKLEVKEGAKVIDIPGTFPRIASITRLGIVPITSVWQNINSTVANKIKPAFEGIMNDFNYCVEDSIFGHKVQNITKQNSFDGNQNALPTSGDTAFWWSDIPNS